MNSRTQKIGLGTAQWGLNYGVSNSLGQTPVDEVGRILSAAKAYNISLIDTAALYGDSEKTLGFFDLSGFSIVTKTPHFNLVDNDSLDLHLIKTFENSLNDLNQSSIYCLLAHNVNDFLRNDGDKLIKALLSLKESGKVIRIGVSIYDATQIDSVLSKFIPDVVQLPLNVFDQRLIKDGTLNRLKTLGVEIHARSVFLQGLLLMDPNTIPAYFNPWRNKLLDWQSFCLHNSLKPQHASLSFVCDIPEVNYSIIGVQNCIQLHDSLDGLDNFDMLDYDSFACNDTKLINPSFWSFS